MYLRAGEVYECVKNHHDNYVSHNNQETNLTMGSYKQALRQDRYGHVALCARCFKRLYMFTHITLHISVKMLLSLVTNILN